ncbi:MAG TPA: hypothetical protein VMU58_11425, partial [Gaiellaceae bacterium]|nr:hypothetical protein [Gaiellaceae bacterium]
LAAKRIELEQEGTRLDRRARELEARSTALDRSATREVDVEVAAASERERALEQLEAKLETRERELALIRQGLDAERNVLLERERALRRREVADMRESFAPPLAPPSFSDGLAALARLPPRD